MQFLTTVLGVVLAVFATIFVGSYNYTKITSFRDRLFTSEELALYTGPTLYLAVLGSVYNVTRGVAYYGPGAPYNFFVGRDASVAFVTGDFEHYDPLNADDVLQLGANEFEPLIGWRAMYAKNYEYKGKLIGRFYDHDGEPTDYHKRVLAALEIERGLKQKREELRYDYPDCNVEWSEEAGTRVWCSRGSTGRLRSWAGFPRKFYELGSTNFRCACIPEDQLDKMAKVTKRYRNCKHNARECRFQRDD